jgi:hypothetical protein
VAQGHGSGRQPEVTGRSALTFLLAIQGRVNTELRTTAPAESSHLLFEVSSTPMPVWKTGVNALFFCVRVAASRVFSRDRKDEMCPFQAWGRVFDQDGFVLAKSVDFVSAGSLPCNFTFERDASVLFWIAIGRNIVRTPAQVDLRDCHAGGADHRRRKNAPVIQGRGSIRAAGAIGHNHFANNQFCKSESNKCFVRSCAILCDLVRSCASLGAPVTIIEPSGAERGDNSTSSLAQRCVYVEDAQGGFYDRRWPRRHTGFAGTNAPGATRSRRVHEAGIIIPQPEIDSFTPFSYNFQEKSLSR